MRLKLEGVGKGKKTHLLNITPPVMDQLNRFQDQERTGKDRNQDKDPDKSHMVRDIHLHEHGHNHQEVIKTLVKEPDKPEEETKSVPKDEEKKKWNQH